MNAGRDVERLIAAWLVEEAPAHAPDRVLDDAAARIDRTKQRRFSAAWREPMIISTGRLLAAAAVVVIAVVGAGWIGRSTASVGQPAPTAPAPTASPTPSPSLAPSVTIATFRTARDAICRTALPTGQGLNDQLAGVYDPALTAAQRAPKIDALRQIVALGIDLRRQTAAIPAPPEMTEDLAAVKTRSEDLEAILVSEIALLEEGKLSEAQALDQVTDPINRVAEAFEQKYALAPCP